MLFLLNPLLTHGLPGTGFTTQSQLCKMGSALDTLGVVSDKEPFLLWQVFQETAQKPSCHLQFGCQRASEEPPRGERNLESEQRLFLESFGMERSSGVERGKMYCCTESLKCNIWKVGEAGAQCLNFCRDEQCRAATLSWFSVPPKNRYHSASCQQENIPSLFLACKREGCQGNLVKTPFHQQKMSCFLQSCFI